MEQKQITLEEIYYKLLNIERALESKGIIIEDDEGELTDEFKARLEKARKTPLSEYIDHEEVKRKILAKRK
ncbi:MAG: hypothetical protein AABX73_00260 [Nanoarchaeota archaeon]